MSMTVWFCLVWFAYGSDGVTQMGPFVSEAQCYEAQTAITNVLLRYSKCYKGGIPR